MRDEEYAELRAHVIQQATAVGLAELTQQFFFETRGNQIPIRQQIIRFLSVFRREVAMRDNATVTQALRRIQRSVDGDVEGIQVAIPAASPGVAFDLVDLGRSAHMADVLRQIDELQAILIEDRLAEHGDEPW